MIIEDEDKATSSENGDSSDGNEVSSKVCLTVIYFVDSSITSFQYYRKLDTIR
jgi:hypothetical protein